MALQDTPPSSTSSTNGASPNDHHFRVVRKRNRVPLSCAPCRHRKLKCNRGHPCDNCTKRSDIASCNYAAPGSKKKGVASPSNATPGDMQNRIDRLEGLVLSLMTSGQAPSSTAAAQAAIDHSRSNSLSAASDRRLDREDRDMIREADEDGNNGDDSEVDQVSRGIGIMKVDNNGRALFASDAHWYAILGELSEVKNYFLNHKEDYNEHIQKIATAKANEDSGNSFLFQASPTNTKEDMLAAFPTKANADRLIARYFNAYDPSVHIIHGPSFQKQYDTHWLNPSATSIVWIGMCFAMCTLALQSYQRAGDEPPEYRGRAQDLSQEFRRLTAQCLLLSDITQPIAQILETMVLHVQAEYGRSRDAEPSVLLLTSLSVRLAMRMGYHRDPGPHPQITPFQGELRRRVWTFVRHVDLMISFQFGLPAMIRSEHIDTEMPRNIYDDELHEDMKVLPPSRPAFEATPMSYMRAKSRVSQLFGVIVERTGSVSNPPTYEETMKWDSDLREARQTHPQLLQMRSFQESARDPANLIMQRLGLEMVYLRSLFVLHRRFIARGRENPKYAYSRRTCIDASMQLLAHQATLHQESQPGGRLRSVKWYISSLTTHDFLLAAMLVCLDLYHTAEMERKSCQAGTSLSVSSANPDAGERRDEMMKAVEHCISIWESLGGQSTEAYKASLSLRVMVDKLKAHRVQQGKGRVMDAQVLQQYSHTTPSSTFSAKRNPTFGIFPNGLMNVSDVHADDLPPEQSAAMTLGMLSSGGISPGPGFGLSMSNLTTPDHRASYPANMAGLLNDPLPERTGLTPQYAGPDSKGMSNAASPFTQMFGQNAGSFTGIEGIGGDVDWVSTTPLDDLRCRQD